MIAFPPAKSVRICFVCDEYPPARHGGIGSLIQTLARSLVAEGHEARVIGTQSPGCDAPTYEVDRGVRVWRMPASRVPYSWPLARLQIYRKVSQWCREKEIDVVEVADFNGPAAYWPKLPVPVIARLHGSATYFAAELNRDLRRLDFLIERASFRRADFVCSISRYAAERSADAFASSKPIEVLHDFTELPVESTRQPRCDNTVLYSGTLTAKKGVVQLFDAWKQVSAERPDARLHLYGKDCRTDDGRSMKETLISKLEPAVRETVVFHGHRTREELFAHLSRARVGVFPSFSETFGLGPVESMAAGCPTIYGHCGCAGEIIRDGIDGLLVDPNRPELIAAAILNLIGDDEQARRLGEAGRRRVQQKFSLETMLHRNEDFYWHCIHSFSAEGRLAGGHAADFDGSEEIIGSDLELMPTCNADAERLNQVSLTQSE